MGKVIRKRYTAVLKAKMALEAVKGELTLAELAAKHGIYQKIDCDLEMPSRRGDGGNVHQQGRREEGQRL